MSAAIFGLYPFLQPNSELNTYVLFATYSATNHIIWAFGVAWVIFACETHNGGKIRALLSLKMWRQLSCLSYSIYLVHLPLMSLNIIAARAPIYINWMSGIEYFAGDFLILLSAGLLLHTVVERPFMYFFKFCSSMLDGKFIIIVSL
ncbi:hypothetical protein C0J52_12696 [Blattella germanica]|nr:hypothetical protein C0J52_12696 [Blattella germanica]